MSTTQIPPQAAPVPPEVPKKKHHTTRNLLIAGGVVLAGIGGCSALVISGIDSAIQETQQTDTYRQKHPKSDFEKPAPKQDGGYTKAELKADLLDHGIDPALLNDPELSGALDDITGPAGHSQAVWNEAYTALEGDTEYAKAVTHLITYFYPAVADHARAAEKNLLAGPAPAPVPEEPQYTSGQENAIATAKDYLDFDHFSKKGLIEQLEYEGYSHADAAFAVRTIHPNWNEQAAGMAKDYLDFDSFSHSGLVEQLEYEGFTTAQAEYGVTEAGL